MIDFTGCQEEINMYRGSEKKKTLIYEGKRYLVKFPDPVREKNRTLSYINNVFSEYVGSNIFKLVGMKVQDTILGSYEDQGRKKVICACLDFTDDRHSLLEFETIALSMNTDKKITTELADIMEVLDEFGDKIDREKVKETLWDMFIIDGLIGNTDRHNGNWGFLLDKVSGNLEFSPIFDCGSCLNPMYEDQELEKLTEAELKNLAVNCYSCLKENGKRISYVTYIREKKNKECNAAVVRMFPKISIISIENFIDGIDCMSLVRRNFYKKMITERYYILKSVYHQLVG